MPEVSLADARMDDIVIRSMLKWPDVPDVYGWLQLDRRGNWRMRNASGGAKPSFEPIGNSALRQFIARNYSSDRRGCWFFQNGPQRVFLDLEYAPFVFRLENDVIADQCGDVVGQFDGAWLDEEGSLVLRAAGRVGLLDDRDLSAVAESLAGGEFRAGKHRVRLGELSSREAEPQLGFVRHPKPTE